MAADSTYVSVPYFESNSPDATEIGETFKE